MDDKLETLLAFIKIVGGCVGAALPKYTLAYFEFVIDEDGEGAGRLCHDNRYYGVSHPILFEFSDIDEAIDRLMEISLTEPDILKDQIKSLLR